MQSASQRKFPERPQMRRCCCLHESRKQISRTRADAAGEGYTRVSFTETPRPLSLAPSPSAAPAVGLRRVRPVLEPPPQGRAGHTDRAAAGNHPRDQQPWAELQQGSCLKNTPSKPDTKALGDSSPSPTERRSQERPRFRSRSRSWTSHGQITLRYHTRGVCQQTRQALCPP